MTDVLHIKGPEIVDPDGQSVLLRGCGLGGWMNMENFITGYPGTETQHREALADVIGQDRADWFFDQFLTDFFGDADAAFIREIGMNSVRLPINYRHFERDDQPFEINEDGFRHLDRAIELCAQHGLYTIIDLHALPGFQNQGWHSDNPTHKAFFWDHPHFQDRAVELWRTIASRYCGHRWVAGYNPVNEPADPTGERLIPFYERVCEAIWEQDPEHLVFLEGNRYSTDFSMFGDPWPNVVYSLHDYALPGFIDGGPYPGVSRGQYVDRDVLHATFERRANYMLRHNLPLWIGEFGPVYTGEPVADDVRYQVLRDQLEIYDAAGAHWSIWTYKDIGLQGLASLAPTSPWMQHLEPVLEKKTRLGVDSWGATDEHIKSVLRPLEKLFADAYPDYNPFPYGAHWLIHRLVRHILLSEPMAHDWAELFADLDDNQLRDLVASFRFDHCERRERLVDVLAPHLK